MLFYKSKFQRSVKNKKYYNALNKTSNEGFKNSFIIGMSSLDNFLLRHKRTLGNSSIMSKVFFIFGLTLVVGNLSIVSKGYGISSLFVNIFLTYDYYNMGVCLVFIGFSGLWAGYSVVNLNDSLRFSGEVMMVSCLVTVGFSIF